MTREEAMDGETRCDALASRLAALQTELADNIADAEEFSPDFGEVLEELIGKARKAAREYEERHDEGMIAATIAEARWEASREDEIP